MVLHPYKKRSLFVLPLLVLWFVYGCATQFIPVEQAFSKIEINEQLPADSGIINYYKPYKQQLEAEMGRVIGRSAIKITRSSPSPESLMGNFFTDAILMAGKKFDPELDFSFGTKGGLRVDLPEGDITIGNVFELMPFENQLVILELSSESVERIAQFIASSNGQPVSGMTLHIEDGKAQNIRIKGQALRAGKTYKLLTYDYLANGGDNARGMDNPLNRIDLPQKVREALIVHIEELNSQGKQLNPKFDGRVTNKQ